jgi:Putative restriction endonuclease
MDAETLNPPLMPPTGPPTAPEPHPYGLSPEELPRYDQMVLEDGKPVENIFAEKQQRLLTEPLYSSWSGPTEGRSFLALANVGLFFSDHDPPLAPDVMLSLDVPQHRDLSRKEHRSYIVWVMRRPPTVAIEIVSDRRGGEETHKPIDYADIGVIYYVIFDPQNRLKQGPLRLFTLIEGAYQPRDDRLLPVAGLGLTLWEGAYEGQTATWLRWCLPDGKLVPTGRERAEQERERADRLAAQLRALGVEPEA